jgi:hypothetical protein
MKPCMVGSRSNKTPRIPGRASGSPGAAPRATRAHMTAFHAALLLAVTLVLLPARAEAIPAFSRKYATSCMTCHTIFPKLNAHGQAFRLRGYRMPEPMEEAQPPVSLGAPAYKRLWPHAVWPGAIPSSFPFAINIKFADVNSSSLNEDGSVSKVKNDFQFPQEVNLFGAGTLGDHISAFSELTFGVKSDNSVETGVEHAHIGFDSPFGHEDLFHFRIGKFTPNAADVFQEMFITTDAGIDTLFNYNPIGLRGGVGLGADEVSPNPISFPALVQGIEAYGIVRHRLLYVAGVCNGISAGNGQFGNNSKDLYGRLDYKIGGLGLDGDMGGKEMSDKSWRDDSLRVGAFVYRGSAAGVNFPVQDEAGTAFDLQDRHFLRTGFFASAYVRDLNVFGAYLHGSDTLDRLDPADGALLGTITPDFHAWFVQADYVFYPWLVGSVRYETLTPADRSVQSVRVGTANVSALVRANVKAMLEYQRDLREGTNHTLDAVLRFAF